MSPDLLERIKIRPDDAPCYLLSSLLEEAYEAIIEFQLKLRVAEDKLSHALTYQYGWK